MHNSPSRMPLQALVEVAHLVSNRTPRPSQPWEVEDFLAVTNLPQALSVETRLHSRLEQPRRSDNKISHLSP